MPKEKRARDWNIQIGELPTGPRNKITDVEGVTVGHVTLHDQNVHTGVTAILPHQGNLFKEKVVASSHVFNGFGKTIGTIQLKELGTIETPILLTNTLSVGNCTTGLMKYMLQDNPEIGRITGTINPVVAECNDMYLNDIRSFSIKEDHVFQAIEEATLDYSEGAVGAGKGMKCFGLKGGIGSASRQISIGSTSYTLGVLVLTNFGKLNDLVLAGKKAGEKLAKLQDKKGICEEDKGSIIMITATDLPVSDRQLNRIIKRCGVGLSRTGSNLSHGSGDIVIGFSTANRVSHEPQGKIVTQHLLHEETLNIAFQGIAEATEEAIINSMLAASSTTGRDGNTLYSLSEYMNQL